MNWKYNEVQEERNGRKGSKAKENGRSWLYIEWKYYGIIARNCCVCYLLYTYCRDVLPAIVCSVQHLAVKARITAKMKCYLWLYKWKNYCMLLIAVIVMCTCVLVQIDVVLHGKTVCHVLWGCLLVGYRDFFTSAFIAMTEISSLSVFKTYTPHAHPLCCSVWLFFLWDIWTIANSGVMLVHLTTPMLIMAWIVDFQMFKGLYIDKAILSDLTAFFCMFKMSHFIREYKYYPL